MLQNNLETKILPSWVDDFNGIFGLFDGITSIFDKIFGTTIGDENIELEEILKNQELLNELRDALSDISGDLETIIKNGELNTELLNQLIKISNGHGDILNNIQSQIEGLRTWISRYLAEISGMLKQIVKQNNMISIQLVYITEQLSIISQKLDVLNVNVLISSTITEITPSHQRMKYINQKYAELATTHTQTYAKIKRDNSNVILLDIEDSPDLKELIELAKNVTKNSQDSFEFYLETFQDVMVGQTLFERSALHTICELIRSKQATKSYGSEVAKAYTFLVSLVSIQSQSYTTLAACRKILGLSDIDFTPTLTKYIEEQLNIFKFQVLPTLSNEFAGFNHIDIGKGADDRLLLTPSLKANPGYALVGFEILKNEDDQNYDLIGYQAKLKPNYEIDKEFVSKIVCYKINEGLGPRYSSSEGEFNTNVTFIPGELEFPEGYVITELEFIHFDYSPLFYHQVTANRYDPVTGTIYTDDVLTKESITEKGAEWVYVNTIPEGGVYFPSKISDTFLSPMHSFKLDANLETSSFNITSKNYLSQYLEVSDLSNKETNLLYIVDDTIKSPKDTR